MKIGVKLTLSHVGMVVIPVITIGLILGFLFSRAMEELDRSAHENGVEVIRKDAGKAMESQAFATLEAVRAIKQAQITNFFSERQGDIGVLAETVGTLRKEAFAKLSAIQETKKLHIQDLFRSMRSQLLVIKDSPFVHDASAKFELAYLEAGDSVNSDSWKGLANKWDATFKDICTDYGWYDLFLIDSRGNLVYTMAKESDLGMSLEKEPLKSSTLGKAFHAIQKSGEDIVVGDFAPYAPSNNEPASFMISPLKDELGKVTGYVAFQISLEAINDIMTRRTGLGKTGETYLIGQDKLMRSDSFLDPVNHTVKASFANQEKGMVDTEAAREALAGKSGAKVITDYNGNPVLSSYSPLNIQGLKWAIIAEIDVAEAFSPVDAEGKEFYAKYTDKYGYYDLFLVNPDGYCFYTVAREADFQTNLVSGKYADSGLGRLVKSVLDTKKFGMADFAPYAPSNGEPASFIAQPVVNKDGQVEVVIALQVSLEAINKIMQERTGMGKTGESYLVGPDKLMRSDSFLDPDNHSVKASFANPGKGSVDTEGVREALAGNTGTKIIKDYLGNPVLSSFAPLDIFGTRWVILTEVDEAEALATAKKMDQLSVQIGEQIEATNAKSTRRTIWATVIVVAGLSLLGFIIAWFIARGITKPIRKVVDFAGMLRIGDLSANLATGKDEIGEMGAALNSVVEELNAKAKVAVGIAGGDLRQDVNVTSEKDILGRSLKRMVENLNEVLGQVQEAAGQVNSGAGQVSDAGQALSQGATEQAASLEEITSSMTQVGAQTKTNAENAGQANQLAISARESADGGNAHMQEMITAMSEINDSSKEIAKIIKTIDDIAFQTNLLALNAAVEAARAGKHGKGFAVVAQEVRNLAGRSAKAAQETTELIEGSVRKVENGGQIVNKTAEALGEIVDGITKVTDLVGEIAAASTEQAQGIAQINQGLGQVDQVTQQNTASAEESASAAEELASMATQLQQTLAGFKLMRLETAHRPGLSEPEDTESWAGRAIHNPRLGTSNGGNGEIPPSGRVMGPDDAFSLDDRDFGKY